MSPRGNWTAVGLTIAHAPMGPRASDAGPTPTAVMARLPGGPMPNHLDFDGGSLEHRSVLLERCDLWHVNRTVALRRSRSRFPHREREKALCCHAAPGCRSSASARPRADSCLGRLLQRRSGSERHGVRGRDAPQPRAGSVSFMRLWLVTRACPSWLRRTGSESSRTGFVSCPRMLSW